MAEASDLVQFVGLVIPISLISIRMISDHVGGEDPSIPEKLTRVSLLKQALLMILSFIVAAWAAILQIVTPTTISFLVEIGYLFVGLGLLVPAWIALSLIKENKVKYIE